MTPPMIRKYCMSCERITKFKYNPSIGHSQCTICGWRKIPIITTRGSHVYRKNSNTDDWLELISGKEGDGMNNLSLEKFKRKR